MKALKKIFVSICSIMALGCLVVGGFSLKADVAEAGSSGENYLIGGASVRLVNDHHGPGVKYHVWMTLDEFDRYGSINGDTLTLDSGYTTGTIVLPAHLLKGDDLTFGYTAANGAKAHCEYTNKLWHKVEIDHLWYAESIVYMHNIPASQYGTEMAVRGVVFKDGEPIRYTQQENHISMSYVANEEYKDANTKLNSEQLESLYNTYIKKDVNVVVDGVTHTLNVDYLEGVGEIVPAKQADGDEFAYFSTASGKQISLEEATKNHQTLLYAIYRESIVLSDATPSYNLGAYKHNATDTVKSMTFTAKGGTTYDLGANPDDVTVGAGYATLKTAYADHGEGTVTAVLNDGSADYTLTLPVLMVTAQIKAADLNQNTKGPFMYCTDNPYFNAGTNTIDGYYTLGSDISFLNTPNNQENNQSSISHDNVAHGFIGTFDGRGFTMTHTQSAQWGASIHGLFGIIGTGAKIKNTTIKMTGYTNDQWKTTFAMTAHKATFDNITVELLANGVGNYDGAAVDCEGLLITSGISGCTFNNVTVELNGQHIESLFGGRSACGYEYDQLGGQNTYNNFVINGTVDYIGRGASGDVTIDEEVAAGGDIIYNGVGATENRVTLDEQAFVFNGTTASRKFALNLGAHDDGFTVESIKFGSFDLGTNPNALDVSALREDLSAHGEGDIVVSLANGANKKTITVPTTFVTQEITNTTEFMAVLALKADNAYWVYPKIDGYFRLANDIGDETWVFANNNRYETTYDNGFRGTFDGNGYTITGQSGNGGLFECVGAGAIIKNLNIINTGHTNKSHIAVLGLTVGGTAEENAVLENVNIKFQAVADLPYYSASTGNSAQGWITSWGVFGTTFRNVTFDASSIMDKTGGCRFSSVFGRYNTDCYGYCDGVSISNTYENLILKGKFAYSDDVYESEMGCLGYDAINKAVVTVADEIASGANIILNGAGWTEETVTLAHTEEFMMLHTTFFIDIGEYANHKIESITLDGVDLGTDLENLDLSTFRTDYKNHGEKTIKVQCVSGSTRTTVNVPVVLISKTIWTESDLKEVLLFKASNRFYDTTAKAIFGYFRLKTDILNIAKWSNHPDNNDATIDNDSFTHENKAQGFRGTFDGATHTLSTNNAGAFGLFTSIGEGAVIKNVNIHHNVYINQGYATILANYIQGATLENVNVTTNQTTQYNASLPTETIKEKDENGNVVKDEKGNEVVLQSSRYEQAGYLCVNGASGTTFRNVTVNTNGDIYTLFGGYTWQEYEKTSIGQNVYEDFVVNATTLDYVGFKSVSSVSTGVSMEEEIFSGSGIRYNENGVEDLAADLTLEHHDIVLAGVNAENGSKQKIDFGMYLVYGQSVKAVSIATPSGDTHNFTYDAGLDLLNGKITDILPEAILNDVTLHGEGYTLVITTQYDTKVTVPIAIVTYEITQGAELDNAEGGLLMFNTANPYFNATTNTIDGYFTLGKDISFWSTPNNITGNDTEFSWDNVNHGFIGTFDGRNFTVTSTAQDHVNDNNEEVKGGASVYGLFGQLGTGALVKNVHIAVNTYAHGQHTSALAETAYNAKIENVTISVTTINGDAYGYNGDETLVEDVKGLITARGIGGCTFEGVTVNLNGGRITSLFGGRQHNGYEYAEKAGQNTYNGLTINGTVDYIGTGMDANRDRHSFTIQEEIDSGANITYNPNP